MFVQFSLEAASQAVVGQLGASWITAALKVADPVASAAVLPGTASIPFKELPPDRPLTAPGSYWAQLVNVYEASPGSFRLRQAVRPLTAAGVNRVIATPAASCVSATARILMTDDRGYPRRGPGAPGGEAVVDFEGPDKSTGEFAASLDESDPDKVRSMLALVREYVATNDVTFGMIRGWATRETAFEKAWGAGAHAKQAGHREQLRGYGWLTIVPAELARRIQQNRLAKARSALHLVDTLPNGALWLQATADPRDYPQAAMRAMFEAVVDVLPDGQPVHLPWPDDWVRDVVYEDAATWR